VGVGGGEVLPRGSHQFATLDGLRGIAAFAVMTRHCREQLGGVFLPHSYLAVDFFFVLSGFVLAHAYEQRLLSGMTTAEFLRIRLVRLYPLYLIGTVLCIAAAASVGGVHWLKPKTTLIIISALAFLPDPRLHGTLFMFNPPAWSLFFELIANALYASIVLHLSNRRLALIAASCLVIEAIRFDSLGVGFRWEDLAGGFLRVGFGFFAGVLTYRLWRAAPWRPALPAWCVAALLVLILAIGAPPWGHPYNFLTALLFPLIVFCGASQEPSWRFRPIFLWLGAISYALYISHQAVILGGAALLAPVSQAPWTGLLMLAIAVALAAALSAVDPLLRQVIATRLPTRVRPAGGSEEHAAAPQA
jgi:peptidoglycan/LPS O-acetylase OafA/YrhL